MVPWAKVVTNPLGLAGFALFLVFGFLGQVKQNSERRWVSRVAVGLAVVALFSGVGLAYLQVSKSGSPSSVQSVAKADATQQQNGSVNQTGGGAGSNNVQRVQGNVTIIQNQAASMPSAVPTARRAESAPRPWVAVEGLDASTPLTFDPRGSASAQVRFLLRDNGDAPAAEVDVRGSLFAISLLSLSRKEIKDTEVAFCD